MQQLAAEEQHRRGVAFAELHRDTFVIPNPWDAGSARLLTQLGFPALATTSAGLAYSLGRGDGAIDRDETLANARTIVAATDLPVSADLEDCYASDADGIGETIRLAAEAGAVGGSIEDATGDPDEPIRPFETAVERVAAAVEAARALPFPFTLTARAENFLYGRQDLDDTIRRLQAFEEAGADVLFAPALPDLDAVRTVCAAVSRPVNHVTIGGPYSVAELRDCGVRRISLGSALARAALGEALSAAREIQESGTFTFTTRAVPYAEINALLSTKERT
ncbi:isocitrate lyase/phosphoenolpyruvate mutase family protein [Actinophytocola sp.]|uniref:isocitrate lyase/PEP mutase family protein n=1 Tax=Actinophytocola sp. TaxID=1872138 RepID=UPI002ED22AA0